MTNIIVKSYTVLYMCLEVIICQFEWSPQIFIISQTTSLWGTSKHIGWEQEYGANSPSFWDEFCKILATQNSMFLTFQNDWNLDLSHLCSCSYNIYNSKKLYCTVYVHGSYHLSVWEVPWNVYHISAPLHIGDIRTHEMGMGMWRKPPLLLGWVL